MHAKKEKNTRLDYYVEGREDRQNRPHLRRELNSACPGRRTILTHGRALGQSSIESRNIEHAVSSKKSPNNTVMTPTIGNERAPLPRRELQELSLSLARVGLPSRAASTPTVSTPRTSAASGGSPLLATAAASSTSAERTAPPLPRGAHPAPPFRATTTTTPKAPSASAVVVLPRRASLLAAPPPVVPRSPRPFRWVPRPRLLRRAAAEAARPARSVPLAWRPWEGVAGGPPSPAGGDTRLRRCGPPTRGRR